VGERVLRADLAAAERHRQDHKLLSSAPEKQADEFNGYIARMNAANGELGLVIAFPQGALTRSGDCTLIEEWTATGARLLTGEPAGADEQG
jgi:hypothetical protein